MEALSKGRLGLGGALHLHSKLSGTAEVCAEPKRSCQQAWREEAVSIASRTCWLFVLQHSDACRTACTSNTYMRIQQHAWSHLRRVWPSPAGA